MLIFLLGFQGVKKVLVKLGQNGSILFNVDEAPIAQPALMAPIAVDTTGAGDTFTAAYAVALIEGQTSVDALRFAGEPSLISSFHSSFTSCSTPSF